MSEESIRLTPWRTVTLTRTGSHKACLPDMRAIAVTTADFNGFIAHKDMPFMVAKDPGSIPQGVADPLDLCAGFKECPTKIEIEIDPVSFRSRFKSCHGSTSVYPGFRERGILG